MGSLSICEIKRTLNKSIKEFAIGTDSGLYFGIVDDEDNFEIDRNNKKLDNNFIVSIFERDPNLFYICSYNKANCIIFYNRTTDETLVKILDVAFSSAM